MSKKWHSIMDAHFGVKRKQWNREFTKRATLPPPPKPESLDDFKLRYSKAKECWFDQSASEIEKLMRKNRAAIESKH